MQYMFENKGKWAKEYRKIDKDNVIVKNGKYYHKKYGYELDFKDGAFHKADVADNAQTRIINKKTSDLANKLDMNKDTHDLADNTERQKLAKLQTDYNKVLTAMDMLPADDSRRKDFEKALNALKNQIDLQNEVISQSHNVNSDKRRQAQIPKMLKSKESADNRSLAPLVATILNNIQGLRTADTYVDKIADPYTVMIPIASGSNYTSIKEKVRQRLQNNKKLHGNIELKGNYLYIHINK